MIRGFPEILLFSREIYYFPRFSKYLIKNGCNNVFEKRENEKEFNSINVFCIQLPFS